MLIVTYHLIVNHAQAFSKAALLDPRCIIGANLGILAGDELSRRQGRYGRTDRGDENTPSALN